MNSKRQVKPQPKKSTDSEFVFTEPQQENNGSFQFTESAEKKSVLMIILIAAGGAVLLLLALTVLAKGLFSSHKNNAVEESQPEEIEEDAKLTTYEDFDISQITDPPLVASKHRPGEKRTLYCKGQAFIFRWCPPGTFTMGAPKSEEDLISEKQHEVTLTRGFWMMETEVTQKQWKSVMRNNPSYYKGDDLPVENVTWYNCQELCKECTKLGMSVQLPTEAQWEYACRAGTTGPFAGNLDEMAWYGSNSGRQTHPVGTKKPNVWDLYDMHGNVWEWCQDWFGDYPSGSVTDPTGPSSGALRIMRGGSCGGINGICRSAFRFINEPDARDNMLGFRVIMTDKNMNEALANNMDQPPKEKTVKEPVDDNKKEKPGDDSSKNPSGNSNNDTAADNGEFDDLIPVLPSGSKTAEPEPSDSESLDSQPSNVGRSHLEPKHKEERKAGDTLVKEIDGVKFVFKWIPPGIFTMGSPEDEEGRNPNERQYKVKISKGFWMMDSEVTQEQWAVVTRKQSSSRPSPRLPIEDVSWNQCNIFCQKAAVAGLPLELPTEAQWEYACRAGSKGSFAGDFEELTWHHGNSNSHANPVRTLKPNKWGLYDMHGNVAEWCSDWCGVYPGKPTKDPKGPNEGSKKMTRGGSWGSPKHFCRSALRGGLEPNQHTVGLGFRCVLNISQNDDKTSNNNIAKRPTQTSNNQEDLVIVKTNIDKESFFAIRGNGKAIAVAIGGGSTESERAVALGLQWIANHQLPNGSWSFNHQLSPSCRGQCTNPGQLDKAFNGATGLALLPFLGAGVTHVNEGKYKTNVNKGISFLCKNGKQTNDDCVSFIESGGTIYSHGIVALCLSEAYCMTKDKKLLPAAQGSLNYISYHQDPSGGGWRYQPHQSGDTSATSWQVSALKTGFLSGMDVSRSVITKAVRFLDSVQSDSGAKYGYTEPGAGPATTAVGLMGRMYLGWKHDNPNLQRGVEWLSKIGPSKSDCYYNFYATQVMFFYNGPLWIKWNAVMRDQMVNSQSQQGHEKGSWYNYTPWTERGGRLYDTALSIMVLETYYRYPAIYKAKTDD